MILGHRDILAFSRGGICRIASRDVLGVEILTAGIFSMRIR